MIYDLTKATTYTICLRILRREDDALDAFQAAYCRLVRLAGSGDDASRVEDCAESLYRFAVREAGNLRKRRSRRQRKEVSVDAFEGRSAARGAPERDADAPQTRELIERLVDTLPDRYRLPILLHYFHGRKHREVAAILGKSTGTISRQIARGLRRLEPRLRQAGLGTTSTLVALVGAGQLISPHV